VGRGVGLPGAGLPVRPASATKNVLAATMNASAVGLFLFSRDVHWLQAALLGVGGIGRRRGAGRRRAAVPRQRALASDRRDCPRRGPERRPLPPPALSGGCADSSDSVHLEVFPERSRAHWSSVAQWQSIRLLTGGL